MRFPHGHRMAPFVFLQVPSALCLQSAKNGCYTGTSNATFHLVLPFYNAMRVVTSDYAISLGNALFLLISWLFFRHYAAFFSLLIFLEFMPAD